MPTAELEHSSPEPLPELDTERLTIHVELPSSHETDKLTTKSNDGAKTADAADVKEEASIPAEPPMKISRDLKQNLLLGRCILFLMAVLSASELAIRMQVMNRWATLMETSSFVDWPTMATHPVRMLVFATPLIVCVIDIVTRQFKAVHTPRRRVLHILNSALMIAAIVSVISFASCVASDIFSTGLSEEAVMRLAMQPTSGAAFNQGYCQAWCRHTDTGLAAFLRGDCGPKTPTVFDEVIKSFEVGDWCKEAIAKQNYELVATYEGVSPFAGLKSKAGDTLTSLGLASLLAFYNVLLGLWLCSTCSEIEKELNKD